MAGSKQVFFARVNRREDIPSLGRRDFGDEMRLLIEAGAFEVVFSGRHWIAADLELDASGDFLMGIIGFASEERLRDYETDARSWKKGPMRLEVGASKATLVPFAVDLREDRRWVAFAPARRIRAGAFATGLQTLLASAATQQGLVPSEWEIDLVASRMRVYEWLEEHPDVSVFVRIVKVPNPGRDLEGDIAEMKALAARSKQERYSPAYGRTLDFRSHPDVVAVLLEGIDTGDLQVRLSSRSGVRTFDSRHELERGSVEDWGEDWDRATHLMLEAVREFSEGRSVQGRLE